MLNVTLTVRDGKDVPLDFETLTGENEYKAFLRAFNDYANEDQYITHKKRDNFLWFAYDDEKRGGFLEVPRFSPHLPSKKIYLKYNPTVSPEKGDKVIFF